MPGQRSKRMTPLRACAGATIPGIVVVFVHAAFAQTGSSPAHFPYPPRVIPADLVQEVQRVQGEVDHIFQQGLAQWRALPVNSSTLRQRQGNFGAVWSGSPVFHQLYRSQPRAVMLFLEVGSPTVAKNPVFARGSSACPRGEGTSGGRWTACRRVPDSSREPASGPRREQRCVEAHGYSQRQLARQCWGS
jgi:hypothetical protein